MSFDAIVIGAGAGGSATAWRLIEHGLKVLLLDSGPRFQPLQDYPLSAADWELKQFPHKPGSQGRYSFPAMQKLDQRWADLLSWNSVNGRYNPGDQRKISNPGYHHVRGIGGSTLHFTGESHRMNPHAMTMQSRFGVAADWPVSYAELEPYYQTVEDTVGIAGPEEQGDRWRKKPLPLPAHPLSSGSKVIAAGAQKLGLNWQANNRAALSQPYDGRPSCNYCGNCNRGCPRGDKGSADVTFIRRAEASPQLTLQANCHVLRLVEGKKGTITAVKYIDNEQKTHSVSAGIVILAGGAIETPRLLLQSKNSHSVNGIANNHKQVGRHFMETNFWASTGIATESISSFKCLPSDSICWDYNRPDAIPNIIGGCRFTTSTAEADLVGPVSYASRAISGWGHQLKQDMRAQFGRAITVSGIAESLPNDKSFVDLDPKHKDRFGQPLARIHSFLPEGEIKKLNFMANTCRNILKSAGITHLVEEYGSYDFFSSTHVFGTCRMGDKPEESVVDRNGKCHELDNLYITDASVFPSSGGGESPSLTIQALAIRSADQMVN